MLSMWNSFTCDLELEYNCLKKFLQHQILLCSFQKNKNHRIFKTNYFIMTESNPRLNNLTHLLKLLHSKHDC